MVFIGRNGSIEMNAMLNSSLISADVMERHTGIWTDLQEWRSAYLNANRDCDVIAAGWYHICLFKYLLRTLNEI